MPKFVVYASQDAYVSGEDALAFIDISDGPSHHDELGSRKVEHFDSLDVAGAVAWRRFIRRISARGEEK
jgi:hypothetical protein